ncbi:MAG: EamA family transporter [Bacteroidales bacterium]|nr:EamA family transporter [Bacteroidales bacterium]
MVSRVSASRFWNRTKIMNYSYIFGTIFFTVYGQLILKWRINFYGALPKALFPRIQFLIKLLLDPYIFSGFISAFFASLCWMAAMTKFSLNHAYPFMGFNFIIVFFLSSFLFNESITILKVIGIILIVAGITIGSQG